MIDISLAAIDELAALGTRFVGWRWETRDGKPTKPPIAADGRYADSTKPDTWMDLGAAMAAAEKHKLDGIGFELDAHHDGIVGIDLDGCRNAIDGVIADWAVNIIVSIASYAEVSPSGTGVKIFCRADPVPRIAANKRTLGRTNGTKAPAVEIYISGRYFCLTGQILPNVPDEIVDATAALERLVAWVAKAPHSSILPAAFTALLEQDASLREAWQTGTKLGSGGDITASGLDFSLARYLRRHLDDDDLAAVLRAFPHGQIGSGRLKGKAAERRIAQILGEIGSRPEPNYQPPLATRSMAELAEQPVPILNYLADGWVPAGKAVLMAGMGGSGKSTLACQLGAARAVMAPFLGLESNPGVSLALLCEEDADDAHRMLAKLARHFCRNLSEFHNFHYHASAGNDNVLVARLNNGRIVPTPFYEQWKQRLGDLKVTLQILDNARHVASIDENDGAQVTAAWSLLHGLGQPIGATTLLLGHIPKSGAAEFSGNAAWENVARVRLFLGPRVVEYGEQPIENDPRRIFRRGKANATGTAALDLVWNEGAFRLENPDVTTYGDQLARDMRKGEACQVFLAALTILTEQRRHTSHSSVAQNFAPKVMREAGLVGDFTRSELTEAMESLFKDGRIKARQELWRGPDRHVVMGIGQC